MTRRLGPMAKHMSGPVALLQTAISISIDLNSRSVERCLPGTHLEPYQRSSHRPSFSNHGSIQMDRTFLQQCVSTKTLHATPRRATAMTRPPSIHPLHPAPPAFSPDMPIVKMKKRLTLASRAPLKSSRSARFPAPSPSWTSRFHN